MSAAIRHCGNHQHLKCGNNGKAGQISTFTISNTILLSHSLMTLNKLLNLPKLISSSMKTKNE